MDTKPDQPHYACGDRIAGRYQLLRPLGVGGMGVVWVAHNLVLDVHVALKLIRRHLAGSLASERLLREARSAARISHPGVVRVFDFGTSQHGDPFIVMELLDGETLRDVLDRELRLSPMRAVATLIPVAEALAALEGTGIVHRDMKPDNVILVRTDEDRVQPKLVDFGVAMVPGMQRLTVGGLIVGTPDYLAPEQAAGEDVDHRADVWAFSVVLFETLTGLRPFSAETVPELLNAILFKPAPALRDFAVDDDELAAIVARGLEKLRERRWSSMRSLANALTAWARARGMTEDIAGTALRGSRTSELEMSPGTLGRPLALPEGNRASGEAKTEIAPGRRNRARPAAAPRTAISGQAVGVAAGRAEGNQVDEAPSPAAKDEALEDSAPPLFKPSAVPPERAPEQPGADAPPEPAAPRSRNRVIAGVGIGLATLLAVGLTVSLRSDPVRGPEKAAAGQTAAPSSPSTTDPPVPTAPAASVEPPASAHPTATAQAAAAQAATAQPAVSPPPTASARPAASAPPTASATAQPTASVTAPAPAASPARTSSRIDDLKDPYKKR